jgi:hypothetical protein
LYHRFTAAPGGAKLNDEPAELVSCHGLKDEDDIGNSGTLLFDGWWDGPVALEVLVASLDGLVCVLVLIGALRERLRAAGALTVLLAGSRLTVVRGDRPSEAPATIGVPAT